MSERLPPLIDQLESLADRRRSGQLDEQAFRSAKRSLLERYELARLEDGDCPLDWPGADDGAHARRRPLGPGAATPHPAATARKRTAVIALVVVIAVGVSGFVALVALGPGGGFPTADHLARDIAPAVSDDAVVVDLTESRREQFTFGQTADEQALDRLRLSLGATGAVVEAGTVSVLVDVYPTEEGTREAARLLRRGATQALVCGRAVVIPLPSSARLVDTVREALVDSGHC